MRWVKWPLKPGGPLHDDAFARTDVTRRWPAADGEGFVKSNKQNLIDNKLRAINFAAKFEKNARRRTTIPWFIDCFIKWHAIGRAARIRRIDTIIEKGLSAVE
ncbi:MAG TPA: hypothetical protein VNL39_12165 [Xanthobacteraceae bacterium]|nr:hypothetical protein [Xanthobacteraceae bacterium]